MVEGQWLNGIFNGHSQHLWASSTELWSWSMATSVLKTTETVSTGLIGIAEAGPGHIYSFCEKLDKYFAKLLSSVISSTPQRVKQFG